MKSKLTILFSVFIIGTSFAQEVPRKIVVEHFTNTLCSTCASRNPGFFTNYSNENNGNMLHLAVHPSSPYSSCIFNQHDKTANDERTKYNGIFGSTPRLVINGSPVSASSSYNSPAIFAPYVGLTSPIELILSQQKFGADSIRVKVVVKTVSAHTLGVQNLYVVLAEDTVFYNAPNGEKEHYDVLRKSLFGDTGTDVTPSQTVGDSVVFVKTVSAHSDWNFSRIYALSILQNKSDKEVMQAEALNPSSNSDVTVGVRDVEKTEIYNLYPNPATNSINIATDYLGNSNFEILSITGELLIRGDFNSSTEIDIANFQAGIYFLKLESNQGIRVKKFMKR